MTLTGGKPKYLERNLSQCFVVELAWGRTLAFMVRGWRLTTVLQLGCIRETNFCGSNNWITSVPTSFV